MSNEFVVNVTLPGTPEHFVRSCSGPVIVGRSDEADIQLVHPLVSRRHAELNLGDDGSFVVTDLGSRNGTILNDAMLENASRSVSGEAVVQVGPYMLRLTPAAVLQDQTFQARPDRLTRRRVELDHDHHVLSVDGRPAVQAITGLEYKLMDLLVSAEGRLVANQEIGDTVWGQGLWDTYMLHNLVRRVRRKLEVQGLPAEELIVSVPGSGYRVG
jgi:pSer/pThr/pTyr-binding forkhead associated (FHA) protein